MMKKGFDCTLTLSHCQWLRCSGCSVHTRKEEKTAGSRNCGANSTSVSRFADVARTGNPRTLSLAMHRRAGMLQISQELHIDALFFVVPVCASKQLANKTPSYIQEALSLFNNIKCLFPMLAQSHEVAHMGGLSATGGL